MQVLDLLGQRRNDRRRQVESWFDIHFYQRVIPEDFFYRQMRMKRDFFDLLLAKIRNDFGFDFEWFWYFLSSLRRLFNITWKN